MSRIYINARGILFICSVLTLLYSCEVFEPNNEEFIAESEKSIDGIWQINNVTRNGQNITEKFDFSNFKINFLSDHTFTIENPVPFMVYGTGNWSLDDPQYPFKITFEEEGKESLVTDFQYPILDGARQLYFKLSPGCSTNVYEYTLVKVSE